MANGVIKVRESDFIKVMQDIETIKSILLSQRTFSDSEGELSDWAKKELAEARKTPNSENITLEEMEIMLQSK